MYYFYYRFNGMESMKVQQWTVTEKTWLSYKVPIYSYVQSYINMSTNYNQHVKKDKVQSKWAMSSPPRTVP